MCSKTSRVVGLSTLQEEPERIEIRFHLGRGLLSPVSTPEYPWVWWIVYFFSRMIWRSSILRNAWVSLSKQDLLAQRNARPRAAGPSGPGPEGDEAVPSTAAGGPAFTSWLQRDAGADRNICFAPSSGRQQPSQSRDPPRTASWAGEMAFGAALAAAGDGAHRFIYLFWHLMSVVWQGFEWLWLGAVLAASGDKIIYFVFFRVIFCWFW